MAIYFTAKVWQENHRVSRVLIYLADSLSALRREHDELYLGKKMQIRPSAPGLLLTVTKEHVSLVEYDQGVAQEY